MVADPATFYASIGFAVPGHVPPELADLVERLEEEGHLWAAFQYDLPRSTEWKITLTRSPYSRGHQFHESVLRDAYGLPQRDYETPGRSMA